MGYISFLEEVDIKKSGLPDLKDKIKIFGQVLKAYNLFARKRFDEAGQILNKSLPLDPENPGIHYLLAQLHFNNAKFEDAIQELEMVLHIDNRNSEALSLLGLCYLNKKEHDKAIKKLEESIDIFPHNLDSLSLLSMAYKEKGDLTKSLEYIEKAISIDSDNIELRLHYAMTLDIMQEDEKVLKEFEYMMEKDPTNPSIYLVLGIFYMKQGKYERGISSFEKSPQLSPSPDVYYYLGFAYNKVGRSREAIESLKKFIEIAPPSEEKKIKEVQKILSSLKE